MTNARGKVVNGNVNKLYEHNDLVDDSFPIPASAPIPAHLAMVLPTPANDNTNINNIGVNLKGLRDQVQQGQTRPIPVLTVIKGDKK